MKKGYFILLGIFLVSVSQIYADKVYGKAILKSATGTVEVSFDWGKTWVPAESNMTLIRNSIVKTGFESSARISSMDAEFVLNDASQLHLEVLPSEMGGTTTLYLESTMENVLDGGSMRVSMTVRPRIRSNLKVATPGSTTQIYNQNTSCDIGVYGVSVISGEAEFVAVGYRGSVRVDAGHIGYVDPSGNTAYK